MLLMLLGCIVMRSNVAYESVSGENRVHISETMRLMNILGPKLHLELAPGNQAPIQQIALGGDISLSPFVLPLIEEWEISDPMHQAIFSSGIGANIFHFQDDEEGIKFGILSPYIQLHTPSLCLDGQEFLCFTAYGEYQYQIFWAHRNEHRWQLGLSMHYMYIE